MADENVPVIKIKTLDAVNSINDLKTNISELKKQIGGLSIDSDEYKEKLGQLNENQNALKDAMYATKASMTDVAKAAQGQGESYNALVHQMAKYKSELRAIDTSSDEGKKKFAEMAEKVNDVNDKLKAMDALQGNYQRNVGNYQTAFKGLGERIDGLGKGFKALQGGTEGFKGACDAVSKTPWMTTIGGLVFVASQLATAMKDNDQVMAAVKKAMNALKPVMDMFSGLLEKVAGVVADLIGKVLNFVTSNGLIDKLMNGIMGVGNAIVKFVIAPFKAVASAIAIFKKEGIKGIKDASLAIKEEMKNGIAFKTNFQAGAAMVDSMVAGAKSKKEEAGNAAKEIADTFTQEMEKGRKKLDEENAKMEEDFAKNMQKQEDQLTAELEKEAEADLSATLEQMEGYFEAEENLRKYDQQKAEEYARAKIATLKNVASNMGSIFGSIADLYEANSENAEKNTKKIKALRIASATIETISGAISAYMSVWKDESLTATMKAISAPLAAASVLAAGMANIASIRNTSVSSDSDTSSTATATATTSAPAVQSSVSNVRSVTTASEEQRLNKMASSQRVYILQSDIQASSEQAKVQVAESSF